MTKKKQETPEEVVKNRVEVNTEPEEVVDNQVDTKTESEEVVEEQPQKKYVVVHDFKDLKDNNTVYIKGDIYPRRADAVVDEERIKELSSTKNKIKKVLIKEQD